MASYIRRMRWLHRDLAVQMVNTYGEAMSDSRTSRHEREYGQRVSGGELWALLAGG